MIPYYGYPYQNDSYDMIPYTPGYLQPSYPYLQDPATQPIFVTQQPVLSDNPARIRLTAFKSLQASLTTVTLVVMQIFSILETLEPGLF